MSAKLTVSCLVAIALCVVAAYADDGGEDGRIVGGTVIHIKNAPYNVQLRYAASSELFCGGALISKRHVLTAAHCFPDKNAKFYVVAGANTLRDAGVIGMPVKIFIHPNYNPKLMHTDVAVIKLDRPITGVNIKPVALADKSPVDGEKLDLTGWGRTADEGEVSNYLRHVSFPARSRAACVNEFRSFVKENMFCGSGYEEKGHCFGDSGGPALCNGKICGINAFGFTCGSSNHQSAFTDVAAVAPFIRAAMLE